MAVIATVAAADANSYLDVASADAFAALELGSLPKAWLKATSEDREAALIRATAEIDEHVGATVAVWDTAQALRFPRSEDVDDVGDPVIPARVSRATFLQAAYLLANVDILDAAASRRARGLANFSNPDGTSGQLADDRDYGRFHPRVIGLLDDVVGGAIIGTIVTT